MDTRRDLEGIRLVECRIPFTFHGSGDLVGQSLDQIP